MVNLSRILLKGGVKRGGILSFSPFRTFRTFTIHYSTMTSLDDVRRRKRALLGSWVGREKARQQLTVAAPPLPDAPQPPKKVK